MFMDHLREGHVGTAASALVGTPLVGVTLESLVEMVRARRTGRYVRAQTAQAPFLWQ